MPTSNVREKERESERERQRQRPRDREREREEGEKDEHGQRSEERVNQESWLYSPCSLRLCFVCFVLFRTDLPLMAWSNFVITAGEKECPLSRERAVRWSEYLTLLCSPSFCALLLFSYFFLQNYFVRTWLDCSCDRWAVLYDQVRREARSFDVQAKREDDTFLDGARRAKVGIFQARFPLPSIFTFETYYVF